MEGRIETCSALWSPMQKSGSPRYHRAPVQTFGLIDIARPVASPRSMRGSSQVSGFVESPPSLGSPQDVQSPRSLPSPGFGKPPQFHAEMCAVLAALVERMHAIGPSLNSERGRFRKAEIQALCAWQLALDKAYSLLLYCADSSKLYMAIKGESMLARFEEVKEGLETSLRRISVLVSPALNFQISELQAEMSRTQFQLDLAEKQIGADIISLLLQMQKGPQFENPEAEEETFSQVAIRLGLVTANGILAEKSALKRLLKKARFEEDRRKEIATLNILQLLKKFNSVLRAESVIQTLGNPASCLVPDRGLGSGNLFANTDVEMDRVNSPRTTHPHCIDCRCSPMTFLDTVHRLEDPECSSPRVPSTPAWRWELASASEHGMVQSESKQDAWVLPVADLADQEAKTCRVQRLSEKGPVVFSPRSVSEQVHGTRVQVDEIMNDSGPSELYSGGPYDLLELLPEEKWAGRCDDLVLGLASNSVQKKYQAAEEIRILAKTDPTARSMFGESGAIPALVELLSTAVHSDNQSAQETVALSVLNLAISDDRNKAAAVAAGSVPLFLELLKAGASRACKEAAVAALLTLSCLNENKACIGSSGTIPLLVQLLISGSNRGRRDALTTLYNLAILQDNRSRVVRAGAIPILVHLLSLRKVDLLEKIVALLYILAYIEEGRSTIASTEGCIGVLAEILDTGSIKEKEHAAATLLLLCTNSLQHSQLVLREGVIPALVSLSVGNNPRGQDKAKKLLQHFREQRQKDAVFSHSAPLSMSLRTGAIGGSAYEAEPQGNFPLANIAGSGLLKEAKKKFGKSRSGSLGSIWKTKVQLPLYQC